jgi:hypothetical protein
MRTSGAATEHRMTLALLVVAVGVAMLLAGGPRELALACEDGLRKVAEAIYQGWRAFTG